LSNLFDVAKNSPQAGLRVGRDDDRGQLPSASNSYPLAIMNALNNFT
jgi:hypothetical protein